METRGRRETGGRGKMRGRRKRNNRIQRNCSRIAYLYVLSQRVLLNQSFHKLSRSRKVCQYAKEVTKAQVVH